MTYTSIFDGFPIDYFTFSDEDFNNDLEGKMYDFSSEKLELEDGFIGNSLFEKINFEKNETTIINCAVGQGKTHAILHSIKEYINTEDSIDTYLVIAVPLVSLVTQYKRDLIEMGFDESQIFSYENISDKIPESGEQYIHIDCKIHIVTVNTLLGNAGEHAILQSERKYNYIRTFSEELSSHGKRLIVIYDEIHEAIRNFTENGIAQLSHFSSVLTKNILLSATYNVQSVPVIKLLANQTNKRIRLLEAERTIVKPQSKLYLHINNEYSANRFIAITEIILDLVRRGKNIDILSYSRTLCLNLADKKNEPGRTLKEAFRLVKTCISTIENNQGDNDEDLTKNRFDNNSCNIGTNFKSGVNIKKENHAFVVILPPASAKSTYTSFNGIFSEGPNAVIQALARQRNVGEIHVVLPKPVEMNYSSLPDSMNHEQKSYFIEQFGNLAIPTSDVSTSNNVEVPKTTYIPFSKHIDEVNKWWEILQKRYEMPMALNDSVKLPSYDNFVIENGEKCTSRTNFLGKDLSSFVVYSSLTNQFFNAKLENIFVPEIVTLQNLQEHMENVYDGLETGNISEMLTNLERSVDFSQLNRSEKRIAKQRVFEYVISKQENTEDIQVDVIHPAYKFIVSYFERFTTENPSDLERQILSFKELANTNIVFRGQARFYKPYSQSQIFSGQIMAIRSVIDRLKQIHPLQKDYTNFFYDYNSATDSQIEKKFYEFIIALSSETVRRQTTVNTIPGSYIEIIRDY